MARAPDVDPTIVMGTPGPRTALTWGSRTSGPRPGQARVKSTARRTPAAGASAPTAVSLGQPSGGVRLPPCGRVGEGPLIGTGGAMRGRWLAWGAGPPGWAEAPGWGARGSGSAGAAPRSPAGAAGAGITAPGTGDPGWGGRVGSSGSATGNLALGGSVTPGRAPRAAGAGMASPEGATPPSLLADRTAARLVPVAASTRARLVAPMAVRLPNLRITQWLPIFPVTTSGGGTNTTCRVASERGDFA